MAYQLPEIIAGYRDELFLTQELSRRGELFIATEDGVPVTARPRLMQNGAKIRVSLDDLARCMRDWVLTDEGTSVILEAEGHTLALLNEDAGIVATLDGTEIAVTRDDFDFGAGHFISAEFLAKNLGGSAQWAEDEKTLILRIPAGK